MSAERAWAALDRDQPLLLELARLAVPGRLVLVGGALRDALLGSTPLDLDLVLEGASVAELAQLSGLPFTLHPRYDNATLRLADDRLLDLVRTRGETYPVPGSAPSVFPADLHTDLARRDFGVNAMGLELGSLTPGGPTPDGLELIDPFGGQRDLQSKTLRPLHALSFRDDPSRLARAARLAARLNFDLHRSGRVQVPDALKYAVQTPRLSTELFLCFQEPLPGKVFAQLSSWGAGTLFGSDASAALQKLDDRRASTGAVPPLVYCAVWLALQPLPEEASRRYGLGEKSLRLLERARSHNHFAALTPEAEVRGALGLPVSPDGLKAADLMALGIPAGPALGRALRFLQQLREQGQVGGAEDEHAALRAYLESIDARPER